CPLLSETALAVLLEPTDNTIQAGCLGHVVARQVFHGKSAHSGRPWLGENAIVRAVDAVRPVDPLEVEIDGLRFVEVLSPVRSAGEFAVEPKQAWTNVADFSSRGVDAVNLGPGATRYAHTRDERVEIAALQRTFEALQRFVSVGSV